MFEQKIELLTNPNYELTESDRLQVQPTMLIHKQRFSEKPQTSHGQSIYLTAQYKLPRRASTREFGSEIRRESSCNTERKSEIKESETFGPDNKLQSHDNVRLLPLFF